MAAMSNNVTCLYSPWQHVSDASDRIAELIDEIPGWDGYEYADITQGELRFAMVLLQEAIPLLEQASRREAKREEART